MKGDFGIGSRVWPGIGKVMEEAAEVTQVCAKLIATGGDPIYFDQTNLKTALENEVGDLLAALEFIQRHCNLDTNNIDLQQEKKLDGYEQWHLNGLKAPAPVDAPEVEEEDDEE